MNSCFRKSKFSNTATLRIRWPVEGFGPPQHRLDQSWFAIRALSELRSIYCTAQRQYGGLCVPNPCQADTSRQGGSIASIRDFDLTQHPMCMCKQVYVRRASQMPISRPIHVSTRHTLDLMSKYPQKTGQLIPAYKQLQEDQVPVKHIVGKLGSRHAGIRSPSCSTEMAPNSTGG